MQTATVPLSPMKVSSSQRMDRKRSRTSVTWIIHNTLAKAEAQLDLQLSDHGFDNPIQEYQEDDDSIASEAQRLGSFEEELNQDLFDAEEEWKESERSTESLAQTVQRAQRELAEEGGLLSETDDDSSDDESIGFHQRVALTDEETEKATTLSAGPSKAPGLSTLVDALSFGLGSCDENEGDDTTAADTSAASSTPVHCVGAESNLVEQNALAAIAPALSFSVAVDALASRIYRQLTDELRILPSYLQRQLHVKPDEHDDQQQHHQPQQQLQKGGNIWTVGVPVLGSASITGKMMLFLNNVIEDTMEELD